MNISTSVVVCTLCTVVAGCGPEGSARDEEVPASAVLDSGNVRFAAGDHAAALAYYRAAAEADDANAAAWFGIHMASLAVGDTAAAADALSRVQRLVPDATWREHPHDVRGRPSPATAEHAAPRAR